MFNPLVQTGKPAGYPEHRSRPEALKRAAAMTMTAIAAACAGCFTSKAELDDWAPKDDDADTVLDNRSNRAPSKPEVALRPPTPSSSDDIEVLITAAAVDPDGDSVTYRYRWKRDGEVQPGLEGATVPSRNTARGQLWEAEVIATDGIADSDIAAVGVTVVNSGPIVESVALSPANPTTNSVIFATVVATDADGDTTQLSYAWSVNGVLVDEDNSSLGGRAHFDKGDLIELSVTATDGELTSPVVLSPPLTVQNTAPERLTVALVPTQPREGEALTCVANAVDDDGDHLTYMYSWRLNGVPYTAATDFVPAGVTTAGDNWRCDAYASDDVANSPEANVRAHVGLATCSDGLVQLSPVGIDMVGICSGTFDMGCTPGQVPCDADESPVRSTTLTRDYFISVTEITEAQFASVMGYNPAVSDYACGDICPPVNHVDWSEAAAFANALSMLEGLPNCYSCTGTGSDVDCTPPSDTYACTGYRLPTEAEWEAAARCGLDLKYAGSDDVDDVAWHGLDPGFTSRPVAQLDPNACGLYDMSGNVAEWTADGYFSLAYSAGSETDPEEPRTSTPITRGGGFFTSPASARVSNRQQTSAREAYVGTGIRLARSAP